MRPFGSPLEFFSLPSASVTTYDGRIHTLLVRHVVRLLDDSQYRVLKITGPRGPVVLKRTNHTIYRNFLQLFISAPRMVNQTNSTDPQPVNTDDLLARAILQCCGTSAVQTYNQGQPYCLGDFHVD